METIVSMVTSLPFSQDSCRHMPVSRCYGGLQTVQPCSKSQYSLQTCFCLFLTSDEESHCYLSRIIAILCKPSTYTHLSRYLHPFSSQEGTGVLSWHTTTNFISSRLLLLSGVSGRDLTLHSACLPSSGSRLVGHDP